MPSVGRSNDAGRRVGATSERSIAKSQAVTQTQRSDSESKIPSKVFQLECRTLFIACFGAIHQGAEQDQVEFGPGRAIYDNPPLSVRERLLDATSRLAPVRDARVCLEKDPDRS